MSAEFPKNIPPSAPPEDHNAHVTEFRNRESEEIMKAHHERLVLRDKIEDLKSSYTKALSNILNEVPEIAKMMEEIRPNDREAVLMADPGMLSENRFGQGGVGNYDTNEGEKLLQYLSRQGVSENNVPAKNRELREKEARIFALREAFFKNVEGLESDTK